MSHAFPAIAFFADYANRIRSEFTTDHVRDRLDGNAACDGAEVVMAHGERRAGVVRVHRGQRMGQRPLRAVAELRRAAVHRLPAREPAL